MPKATHLECSLCNGRLEAGRVANLCHCGGPLLVRYDLDTLRHRWRRREVGHGPSSMWRYAPVLPPAESVVSLGEGWTPLLRTRRLGARLGVDSLWVKDEGVNPTASFKARGLACAISMCVELGIRKVAIASAGNAASALAAYAAAAGIAARIFMPRDVPQANYLECRAYGADLALVDGPIGDCARLAAELCAKDGWFDLGTLKEPYRVEGQKTMGYEVAEQMDWELPDAIFCPTGGGVGIIGMWKAFDEMEKLGWIGSRRPRMIAVQAEGCQPLVRAFQENQPRSRFFENAHTVAAGLRVPKALGDFLVLQGVRESGGAAVAVSDDEMLEAGIQLASDQGVYAAPEGAACVAALQKLLASGFFKGDERIVLYNTGSGLKYPEAYSTRFPRTAAGEQDKLGGLITPR